VKWEAIVVLHAAADGVEPEEWLAKYPLESATVYRKGEADAAGRKHNLSGFKVDLGSAGSRGQLEELVLNHVRDNSALYAAVAKDGGDVSVGIGLMVPPKEPRTVTLTPRTLAVLLDSRITVHVTGYPCMDEEEEEEAVQQAIGPDGRAHG
jgi:hypothetical protein